MAHRPPTPPSSDLVERIKREIAEPGFLRDLTIWAERQVGKVLSIENRNDPNKAAELINDAIVDTCDGVRRWDPEARTLRRHLEQTINSRMWHECERGRRRRHIALDTVSVDDSQDEAGIDVEMSLRREDPRTRPDGLFAQREVRHKVLQSMRSRATRDPELLAFLDAYEVGHHREGEISERLQLTERTFENVLRRFKTIRRHVPPALQADMHDMLIRDGGPAVTSVARRKGRLVEIIVDEMAVNDSNDHLPSLDASSDGERGDVADESGDRDAA